jgi:hypothetical protein
MAFRGAFKAVHGYVDIIEEETVHGVQKEKSSSHSKSKWVSRLRLKDCKNKRVLASRENWWVSREGVVSSLGPHFEACISMMSDER